MTLYRLFVLLLTISLVLPIFVAAQQSIPFTLSITKNSSITWVPTTTVPEPAHFMHLRGHGHCCRSCDRGIRYFEIAFYKDNQRVSSTAIASGKRKDTPYYATFGGVLADRVAYEGQGCLGLVGGMMEGVLEAITPSLKDVPILCDPTDPQRPCVRINQPPISLGTVTSLHRTITLTKDATRDERLMLTSSTPAVLVWFGDPSSATKPRTSQTTNADTEQIHACSDLDFNGICDYDHATQAGCLDPEKDFYKGVCCEIDKINREGCKIFPENGAFCGKTKDDQGNVIARFAAPYASGVITSFSECPQPVDVTFDDTKTLTQCSSTTPSRFFTINNHQYYCDATIPKMTECGGKQPYTNIGPNALTTGQTMTINGKINYCLNTSTFSTNLDYTTNESCIGAGQTWTGTRCCSEADDPAEYYSDVSNENNTHTFGGCWNSTYIRTGEYARNLTDNTKTEPSVINYNGTFYGCQLSDPALTQLTNTDPHTT